MFVRKLAIATRFYTKLLGTAPSYRIGHEAGYVLFPGFSLNLVERRAGKVRGQPASLTLAVRHLDRECARLRRLGMVFLEPIVQGEYARKTSLGDPDGNVLELAE